MKTAFFLALRPGDVELFSLKWRAFDWRRGTVVVRQGKSGLPKTVYPAKAYLDEAMEHHAKAGPEGQDLVCTRGGLPMRYNAFRLAWAAACRKAGVTMRPYDIRHLAATTMLAAGADLAAVSSQLGHASITTTGNTYCHTQRGAQAHAAELMPPL